MTAHAPGPPDPARRRRVRRVRRGSAAVLVVLVLVVAACCTGYRLLPRDHVSATTPGRLTVAADTTGSYRLDDVRLTLAADGRVRIRRDARVVWANQPSLARKGLPK